MDDTPAIVPPCAEDFVDLSKILAEATGAVIPETLNFRKALVVTLDVFSTKRDEPLRDLPLLDTETSSAAGTRSIVAVAPATRGS